MSKSEKTVQRTSQATSGSVEKNRAGVAAYYPSNLYPASGKVASSSLASVAHSTEVQTLTNLRKSARTTSISRLANSGSSIDGANSIVGDFTPKVSKHSSISGKIRKKDSRKGSSYPYAIKGTALVSKLLNSDGAASNTPCSSEAQKSSPLRFQRPKKSVNSSVTNTAKSSTFGTSKFSPSDAECFILNSVASQPSTSTAIDGAVNIGRLSCNLRLDQSESMDIDAVDEVNIIRKESNFYSDALQATFLGKKYQRIEETKSEGCTYLVLDTNFLIGPLGITLLNQMDSDQFENLWIKIPHVVFVELDRLKVFSQKESVIASAKKAIQYLNDRIVSKQDGRIIGQSVVDYKRGFHSSLTSNDDHILECFLQTANGSKAVFLITNDKNLQSRAAVSHSAGGSVVRSAEQLQLDVDNHLTGRPSIFGNSYTKNPISNRLLNQEDEIMAVEPNSEIEIAPAVFDDALGSYSISFLQARLVIDCLEKIAKIIMEGILKAHARTRFGEYWIKALDTSLPWETLQVVVELFCKFRTGVFLDIFTREDETRFHNLLISKATAERSFSIKDVAQLVVSVRGVFDLLERTKSKLVLPMQFDEFCTYLPQIRDMLIAISKGSSGDAKQLQDRCEQFLNMHRLL